MTHDRINLIKQSEKSSIFFKIEEFSKLLVHTIDANIFILVPDTNFVNSENESIIKVAIFKANVTIVCINAVQIRSCGQNIQSSILSKVRNVLLLKID